MTALRTPAGRRPSRWHDHVIAGLGAMLAAAALGAVLVIAADMTERLTGPATDPGGLLAAVWVLGIGLMAAPKVAWVLIPPGAALLLIARRLGLGGWAVAAAIGAALALAAALAFPAEGATPGDRLIGLLIGAIFGLGYWAILDHRCARPLFTGR